MCVFLYISDDEARQIVVRRSVQSGHFGRFTADERAAVSRQPGGNARYDGLDHSRVELSERDVVEEEEPGRLPARVCRSRSG